MRRCRVDRQIFGRLAGSSSREENAGQLLVVEHGAKCLRIDKWRAKDFERSRCAASLRNVCAFEQTHAGINRGGVEGRHVGGWHHPWQAGLVEPHRALPLFYREDGYFTIGKCFVAELLRQLANCAAMPHEKGMHTDERGVIRVKYWPFRRYAIDWIWPIQNNDCDLALLATRIERYNVQTNV